MQGLSGKGKGKEPGSSTYHHHRVPVNETRNQTNFVDDFRFNNSQFGMIPGGDYDKNMYNKLWIACAGPLVYVPHVGDIVYYFLQGHMEQVDAYASKDSKTEMPIYNLPSKILCEIVSVELKAEPGTDEVNAQITLRPKKRRDEQILAYENSPALPPEINVCSFSKKLTQSDTSTHGGFSVPKRHADECLPSLNMSREPPAQELVARDLHGYEWHFRHIFRGQPKRHLLTSGWSLFVTSKKLVAGDSCIFLRGERGELFIGVRRSMRQQNHATASIISGQSMQHGILASAYHAKSTGTVFTVYYHPWTCAAGFLIPYDRYIKSTESDYTVGTRIRMAFEGDDCVEKRIAGTIIGTGDIDPKRWPRSEWRCLQVQWDAISGTIMCPDTVSPWDVEVIESTNRKPGFVLLGQKRPRPDDESFPRVCNGVSQGQENMVTGVKEVGHVKPLVPQKCLDWGRAPMHEHDPFHLCTNDTVSFPGGSSGLPNRWPEISAAFGVRHNPVSSRNSSIQNGNSVNSGSEEWRSSEFKKENDTPLTQPRGGSRFMLFGVNLYGNPPELPSLQGAASNDSLCSVPLPQSSSISETFQVSEPSKSVSGIHSGEQCKNCCLFRSCTKVLKYGTALRRSIDLKRFNGYNELTLELDQMFEFQGSLIDGSSGWYITFTDDEGDMMLIGDYPWQEFRCAVRKLFIYPKEAITN